jgi:hypothetical protein
MEDFIGTALKQVAPHIDFELVETVAANLLLNGGLTYKQVERLVPPPSPEEVEATLARIFKAND